MRNYFIILIVFFLLAAENIHAQNFQWAKRAGLYAFDLGFGIGTDNAGNVYVAGKYEMNAYFGGIYVQCAGNHDIFIAKYSPTGVFQWVRTAGGVSGDYAHALAVDGAGNSYLTGEFEYTTHFGSVALTSSGSNDVFVAKYDTYGNLIWVKKLGGGSGSDKGLGISLSNGNVYVTGNFQGGSFSGVTLISSGKLDIFVAKMTTGGVFQWIRKAGGYGDDEGFGISNDPAGNVYVTGYFTGTANFSGINITSAGGADAFIAKYNPSGGLIWVKKAGGPANDAGNAIKVDNAGRVFVTGGFRYTSYFGSIPLQTTNGNADIFIACYDGNGNAIWAKKAGGGDNDSGRGIAVDGNSNVYLTGNCGKAATFGYKTIYGADADEIFFASYDVSGNFRWVLEALGAVDYYEPNYYIEMGLCICTDLYHNVYASGAYRSNSTFGATTLYPWSTHTQIFVTKIGSASKLLADTLNNQIIPSKTATYCNGSDVLLKIRNDSAQKYYWQKDGVIIKGATASEYRANSPGSYSVLILSGNDSTITDPTMVTESKGIAVAIAPSDPIFCQDSSTVLITNKSDEYQYQWRRNGVTIPGANENSYRTDKPGNYQVKIIHGSCFSWSGITNLSSQSCQKTDSTFKIENPVSNDKTIALETKEDPLLVKIYPNPNNGLFTLEISMVHLTEKLEQARVEVLNAIGQRVYDGLTSFDNGYINEHIELEKSVPPGVYFIQVTIGDKIEKTRMMLSR